MTTTPWTEWEDWQNGMYTHRALDPDLVERCRVLLSDPDQFLDVAREMVREWPMAAQQNIVNLWSGRRAWVGQASCCYSLFATAAEVRVAWGQMTQDAQAEANRIAVRVIEEHRKAVADDAETLFGH